MIRACVGGAGRGWGWGWGGGGRADKRSHSGDRHTFLSEKETPEKYRGNKRGGGGALMTEQQCALYDMLF